METGMLSHKISIALLLMLFITSGVGIPYQVASSDPIVSIGDEPSNVWNKEWAFHQKITPFIQTYTETARYQPIDILLNFDSLCWAENEKNHSIRVCCWDTMTWHELESQIYDLNYSDDSHLSSCRIVFLIPPYANGKESYYVYYHDGEKQAPSYVDHVSVKDAYYYFEPISGISVEGDYYEISQDDEITYGVGQKGQVMNRRLSQITIHMKPGTTTFDILNSDVLTSFAFSYQAGKEDEDEIASDQKLIAKDILIDGNLMIQFMVISESMNGCLRSSNIYTYYFNPSEGKRLGVHVKHEVLEDQTAKGIENADGRYGAIISYHSKSSSMKKMIFGDILPYLHIYSDENWVKEYSLNTNPESSTREWLISYENDCDIGDDAWISYDEGINGETHGVIFSSNENVISNASEERDGIEIKVAEKEYLDVVGAEVDYVSIAFGRNAFEPIQGHDLSIQKGLIVEFDAEFISFQNASYESVADESIYFQTLVQHRDTGSGEYAGNTAIHTLTIIPHLTGRFASFPLLYNSTSFPVPILFAEVYLNKSLVASATVEKPFIGFQLLKIPKLSPGVYTVKVYRVLDNISKRFIGIGQTPIKNDTTIHIYCTWEKTFSFHVKNQHNESLPDVTLQLYQGTMLTNEILTNNKTNYTISAPFNLFESYTIQNIRNLTFRDAFKLAKPYELVAYYKGFKICNVTLPVYTRKSTLTINVYDLFVEITDQLNLPPGVNVKPIIKSEKKASSEILTPSYGGYGRYYFSNLPEATYTLQISYGSYEKSKTFDVPSCGQNISMKFSYTSPLSFRLLSIQGEIMTGSHAEISIKREGRIIYSEISLDEPIELPPGIYTVNVDEGNQIIGSKKVEFAHATTIDIVTTTPSIIVLVASVGSMFLLGGSLLLLLLRKISLNMCLKLIVLSVVFLSLVQPWWFIHGKTSDGTLEKTSEMFLYPQTIIDKYDYQGQQYIDIATIPEAFTQFLQVLLIVIFTGVVLMMVSFILNIVLRRRFSFILFTASLLFVIIVAVAFSVGTTKIAEISVGSLQGSGTLDVMLPSGDMAYMSAEWGFGQGFFLIIFAAVIAIFGGVYDLVRQYVWKKK